METKKGPSDPNKKVEAEHASPGALPTPNSTEGPLDSMEAKKKKYNS